MYNNKVMATRDGRLAWAVECHMPDEIVSKSSQTVGKKWCACLHTACHVLRTQTAHSKQESAHAVLEVA